MLNKYRPNLVNLMQLSETNYMLLLRLLADNTVAGQSRRFFINEQLSYQVDILEVTKYTSKIAFLQTSKIAQGVLSEKLQPNMLIRLYHDARMSEVIESQNIKQIKPRYDYPNSHMRLPDEKQQVMLFLKEWLQLCLAQGKANVEYTNSFLKNQ